MKHVAGFLLISAAFVAANLVGAGVVLVLGAGMDRIHPAIGQQAWIWVLICIIATAAAVVFLRGLVTRSGQ